MNNRTIDKIKKCLRLAKSDNPGEAAAALRQAQKLMAKHNLSSSDIELSDVESVHAKGESKAYNPPAWVHYLRTVVAHAFGVEPIGEVSYRAGSYRNKVMFIGLGGKPEAAAYAYEVLYRQLNKDRKEYLKGLRERRRGVATKQADLFAQSWVRMVKDKVAEVAMTEKEQGLVKSWVDERYNTETQNLRTRKVTTHGDLAALEAGAEAGSRAQLHQGVGGSAGPALLGVA